MPHRPHRPPVRSTALAACATALALAFAGPAAAEPQVLTEHAGDTPQTALPQVGDRPADRAPSSAVPTGTQSAAVSPSTDDGDGNGVLIVSLSLAGAALLGSGTFVMRRRHVAPSH